MKFQHYEFESKHFSDFVVLEERQGNVSLFPHTDQLPILHKALDKEFNAPLSQLVKGVGAYSDDYWKIVRMACVYAFCQFVNSDRSDKLRLFSLLDANKVARITIVQQITEHNPLGPAHRFKFYGGPDFFQEIRMSGRRIVFADHVLQRFRQRAHNLIVGVLGAFLDIFLHSNVIGMSINHGDALILPNHDEFLAFTYRKSPTEYFITTCLSQNEVYALKVALPAKTFNLHYGESFTRPKVRNWNPLAEMFKYEAQWTERKPVESIELPCYKMDWSARCKDMANFVRLAGHNGKSELLFLDNIPGPNTIEVYPGQTVPMFDEVAFLAEQSFDDLFDWAAKNPDLVPEDERPVTKNSVAKILDLLIDRDS